MVVLLVGIHSEGSVWLVREVCWVLRALGVGVKTKTGWIVTLSYHWFYATFCICSSPIAWAWYLCRYLGACKDSSSSQTVSWVWDTSGAVLLGLETPNAQQQMWKCQ